MYHKLIYLAQPYSHENKDVRIWRYEKALKAVAAGMKWHVYFISPIIQSHLVAETFDLSTDFEYWKIMDEAILSRCDEMWILNLPGWYKSVGVKEEYKIAKKHGIPVYLTSLIHNDTDFDFDPFELQLWVKENNL